MSTARKVTVTVCVGSSCHIKGARNVIMRFNELLKEQNLEDRVELKGSFCMERCGEGVNWQINDEIFSSPSIEDGAETFQKKVLGLLKETPEQPTENPG